LYNVYMGVKRLSFPLFGGNSVYSVYYSHALVLELHHNCTRHEARKGDLKPYPFKHARCIKPPEKRPFDKFMRSYLGVIGFPTKSPADGVVLRMAKPPDIQDLTLRTLPNCEGC
jgi:hypothetical protein